MEAGSDRLKDQGSESEAHTRLSPAWLYSNPLVLGMGILTLMAVVLGTIQHQESSSLRRDLAHAKATANKARDDLERTRSAISSCPPNTFASCAQLVMNASRLSDDVMKGRDNNTPGSIMAQKYLIRQLKKFAIGLDSTGEGNNTFRQPFAKGTNVLLPTFMQPNDALPTFDDAIAIRKVADSAISDIDRFDSDGQEKLIQFRNDLKKNRVGRSQELWQSGQDQCGSGNNRLDPNDHVNSLQRLCEK